MDEALKQKLSRATAVLPEQIIENLENILQQTDDHALESVKQNIGGPFGARFAVVTNEGYVYPVGKNVGNAVVSSGIASKHAEHQDWEENFEALVKTLEMLKGQPKKLIELSSGESCINCHAKQEAGLAHLKERGLLEEGDEMHVIFGASYRQTADVAGFNDLVYLVAMQKLTGQEVYAGEHNPITPKDQDISDELVARFSHTGASLQDIPTEVAELFENSDKAVVAIVKDGKIFATGQDERDQHYSRTAEVVALQNACIRNREEFEVFESWDLGGAQVYTSTDEIGPLMLAEGFWSNALEFVTVDHPRQKEWATKEYPHASNAEMLEVIATRPYSGGINSISYSPTENKAQYFWRDKDDAVNYDGAKAEGKGSPSAAPE